MDKVNLITHPEKACANIKCSLVFLQPAQSRNTDRLKVGSNCAGDGLGFGWGTFFLPSLGAVVLLRRGVVGQGLADKWTRPPHH